MQEYHPPTSPSSASKPVKQMVWKLHRVRLETLHLSVEVSVRELETV